MVLVPPRFDDIELLSRAKELLAPAGFGHFSVTTAERHDKSIAFSSQLAHVVSNAYIKSPTALDQKGFSAGSYRDMTRVAWLNPAMWTELFLDNIDALIHQMDLFSAEFGRLRWMLASRDVEGMKDMMRKSTARRIALDQGK